MQEEGPGNENLSNLELLVEQQRLLIERLGKEFEDHNDTSERQTGVNSQCEARSRDHITEIKELADKVCETVAIFSTEIAELGKQFEKLLKRIEELEVIIEDAWGKDRAEE
ncbi:hypothetical protein QAD02_020362 [Eretmocerus hayati]|uniref:Uncharacterized protein n=1 Tax=Eretmocerus hayati TaxID=131215 RepID=A0ACC2PS10_9HYME|nr:hypothetical protein QAD02_020362 [Eretmocerus hayati]